MRLLAALALALTLLSPVVTRAEATFELVEADDGLRDPSPRTPVGGNSGTTLGEQRRQLLERALTTWGKQLESDVPIQVEVSFEPMGCEDNGYPIAATRIMRWISIPQPDGGPPLVYPSALANRLRGVDQYPSSPDFSVEINSSLDTARCREVGAYYGFEPPVGDVAYLLPTLLHEFAHGLGFSSGVDPRSGDTVSPDGVDVFSAHIRDLDLDRTWAELSRAERARSAVNVRRLVFDGAVTNAATADVLAAGAAALEFEPPIQGFTGWIGDTGFGDNPALSPARGPLVMAYRADICAMASGTLGAGLTRPVLFVGDTSGGSQTGCSLDELFARAHEAGAAGVVLPLAFDYAPVMSLESAAARVRLPVVTVSKADAALIVRALMRGPVTAVLGGRKDQLQGADPLGRPLLYATAPISQGSSISHFDTLARPNLLMEAYATWDSVDELDLTVPVLRDLGWTVHCGNGKIDGNEACDDGEANSDRAVDHCRTTCKRASCGDAVVDTGEACDEGSKNSATTPGACRPNCVLARCGDGVLDPGEGCDQGPANGGTAKGACRTTCSIIGCGDGVLDPGEGCDNGLANSDTAPDACRTTCLQAACGDRVIDSGEDCDGDETCTARCVRDSIAHWHPMESNAATMPERSEGGCSTSPLQSAHWGPFVVALAVPALIGRRKRRRAATAT